MTYRIEGLARETYESLLGLGVDALAELGARRVIADSKPGFPCRATLEDAEPGERLILFNYVSHDVRGPYRSAYAVYVRETAAGPASFFDETPPVFGGRTLSMRGFDVDGDLRAALLSPAGQADATIRALFERPGIAEIHVHNAAAGCFAARIVRD
ncbi:MAG TPA: DUF1203 domain-containing protein [Allosphingosinicella sp.]|jgi:hypothetical protein